MGTGEQLAMIDTGPTVVIPARNAALTIGRQLEALSRQIGADPFHVIVVNNGSSDDTATIAMKGVCSRFTLEVVHEHRPGINMARNAGVAKAGEGLILLCDADDEVSDVWVRAMVAAQTPKRWLAGVVDYTALNSNATRQQWGAPALSDCPDGDAIGDRTFGCNCGFERAMWAEVGGFDDRLSGIGGDETEMFMRAHTGGYRPLWVPDAVVAYRLRPGLRIMCRQRFRQGRNQVRISRLPGGRAGLVLVPGVGTTWRALGKLVIALPLYVTSPRRYEWLAAFSRHVGRLVGHQSRWPR